MSIGPMPARPFQSPSGPLALPPLTTFRSARPATPAAGATILLAAAAPAAGGTMFLVNAAPSVG